MSWSFTFTGKRDAVTKAVTNYAPTVHIPGEARQAELAKSLVLETVALHDPSKAVKVSASGSAARNSAGDNGSATLDIVVSPITLVE